jgi:hypothetical protein
VLHVLVDLMALVVRPTLARHLARRSSRQALALS